MDGMHRALVIQNMSVANVKFEKGMLVTRAFVMNKTFNVNLLDTESKDFQSNFNVGEDLLDDEVNKLKVLIKRYELCFSENLQDLGLTNVVQMDIELIDTKPVVYRPYRLSYPERELVRSMGQNMLDADIICESSSSYASPILLVTKKNW